MMQKNINLKTAINNLIDSDLPVLTQSKYK